ncbi:FHA domain-containing serine/threonine-protein kinase [Flavobacterium soyangense]|uniref:non-specific serine/threonine protein kinase n=1 Tax=Flavobacterium soyangense TaxID=2023265 RepID=A0A930XTQ8_9FLAO|nr:FHA domain-containing serine/threonine-protein kinase [Flavobacterium soyangense]MBF2707745.1 protein kinase [Flavobacterium soyangense]
MLLFDNKYSYIKDLGNGGFGKVFLAKEKVSHRFVAIKQLLNTNKSEQEDIIHEIEIVSKFENPNIVTYYHHFYEEDVLYLVMEFCSGGTLRDKISNNKVTPAEAIEWIQSLATCLRVIHKRGIVHHDIKPDNIVFTQNGTIKIADFGVANKNIGTRSYMSPESFSWQNDTRQDPRVDIYALGVTFMELLTGKNPFNYLSVDDIIEKHQSADFPIQELPNWQQEIILKAINKTPELRFQFMVELEEALKAKSVPIIFNKDNLKAAELIELADKAFRTNKWRNAWKYLELANKRYKNNVSVLQALGKYNLRIQKIEIAKSYYERALKLNPRLDVQKDLGWINLEAQKYPVAIGLLSDHLHRNPADYEAYNLLIRCYYETNRYETAMELSKMIMEANPALPCFANNYFIAFILNTNGKSFPPKSKLEQDTTPFIDYNRSVIEEEEISHNYKKYPTLKSKLLFMDFQFNTLKENTITILETNNENNTPSSISVPIIKFGRTEYNQNNIEVSGGNAISRRHCIIINSKDNVWLYDLESTGTEVNDKKVSNKIPLIGFNKISINDVIFTITTDKTKLL